MTRWESCKLAGSERQRSGMDPISAPALALNRPHAGPTCTGDRPWVRNGSGAARRDKGMILDEPWFA
jgi:hypothetical protein